jgi:hypothetical protein
MGTTSIGSGRPVLARNAESTPRRYLGSACHRLWFEHDHAGAHFVERRRLLVAHIIRAPGGHDLAQQRRHDLVMFRVGEVRVIRVPRAMSRCGCTSRRVSGGRLRSGARSAPARCAVRRPPHEADQV